MDQLQSLINKWFPLAQGLIGSIGALALAIGQLLRISRAWPVWPGT